MAKERKPRGMNRLQKETAWQTKREDPAWWEKYFELVAEHGHPKAVLDAEQVPYTSFYRWINNHPELKKKQSEALKAHSFRLSQKIRENADAMDQSDRGEDSDPKKASIAIDAYKWLASRYNPEQFADRQHIDVTTTDTTKLHLETLRMLAKQAQAPKIVNPVEKEADDRSE